MEFKIGDRVTVRKEYGHVGYNRDGVPYQQRTGLSGTVCVLPPRLSSVGVRFDSFIDGHDCDGHCEHGYGWFVLKNYVVREDSDLSAVPDIPEAKLMEVLLDG